MLAVLAGTVRIAAAGQVVTEPRVLVLSWELLRTAGYGQSTREHAAFLVRDDAGELQLASWPWGAESMRASFRGEIPVRAVAIVHTHPNARPEPSHGDIALARKLALPIYVVTRTSVTLTDGRRTAVVARGDWNPMRTNAIAQARIARGFGGR